MKVQVLPGCAECLRIFVCGGKKKSRREIADDPKTLALSSRKVGNHQEWLCLAETFAECLWIPSDEQFLPHNKHNPSSPP